MTARRAPSPTWSVYDGLWEDSDSALRVPYLTHAPEPMTLRGCGLRRRELLSRGAQGAVYAATDPALSPEDDDVDLSTTPPEARGRLVAVKRLFLQSSDFGVRGLAETLLREATLLRYVGARQRAVEGISSGGATLDGTVRVVDLHRVVEAPHGELCLELEHCPLDLARLTMGTRRLRQGGQAWGLVAARSTVGAGSEVDHAATMPLEVVRYLLRRLLTIVGFLHEHCRVLHRDLKLSNVLVTRGGDLRLSDFGSACCMRTEPHPTPAADRRAQGPGDAGDDEDGLYTPAALRTTRIYQAPECLLGADDYGAPAEVWSLGVIFAELLRQRHLFSGDSDLAVLGAVWKLLGPPPSSPTVRSSPAGEGPTAGQRGCPSGVPDPPEPTLPLKFSASVVPPDGYDLLRRMLAISPVDRITIADALAHPFLASVTPSEEAAARRCWVLYVQNALAVAKTTVSVRMSRLQFLPNGGEQEEGEGGEDDEDDFGPGSGGFGGIRFGSDAMDLALGMGSLGQHRLPGLGLGLESSGESDEEGPRLPPPFTLRP